MIMMMIMVMMMTMMMMMMMMAMTITSSVRSELTKRKLQPPGQSVAKMEELEVVFVELVDEFKLLSIKSSSMLSTLSRELSMSASP